MKLKILVVPFAVIIMIVLSIWYIKPEFDTWQAKRATLKSKKVLLNNMIEKNKKMAVWREVVEKNSENKDVVLNYIPTDVNEEDIIDNLNSIAVKNGISLGDFVISSPVATVSAAPVADPAVAVDATVAADEAITNSKLANLDINVSFSAYGEYDKIKSFLATANSLRRFNEVGSLKISSGEAPAAEGGDVTSSQGLLKVEIALLFNYAKKENVAMSVNDAIFSGDLDMSVADSIKNSKNTNVDKLTVGQNGKSNPFVK
jgi:Tfp pilus assembly protein PilO